MTSSRPLVGITMGDPVGVGPEIVLAALADPEIYRLSRPLVYGDPAVLANVAALHGSALKINGVETPVKGRYQHGTIDLMPIDDPKVPGTPWGCPTLATGRAMVAYITTAVDAALAGAIDAVVTCPINKHAMNLAGFAYNGHTELLAERTGAREYAMMMAGQRLRVVLVTIHMALADVPAHLGVEQIARTIRLTETALRERFGLDRPRIAVAGLNPHAGEDGLFGDEEKRLILPAIESLAHTSSEISGPYPSDTLFYQALQNRFDAVVCMYHDQGLIPFKMIHFTDGVNTTLGLPIIRTSVDHGTAYDIAGSGRADAGSLMAAIRMAASQAVCLQQFQR